MADYVYEGLFILDSNKYAQNQAAVSGKVDEIITNCGGEIIVSRFWDERRLAYPIDKHRKGTYWLAYFKLDSLKLTKMNRDLHLCEEVIRSMILKIHPKLVDAIVSHANDATSTSAVSEKKPEAVEKPKTVAATETTAVETTTAAE